MSDDEISPHGFDAEVICEFFGSLDRQGPGSEDATLKALSFVDNLDDSSRIADLGCGSGGQTVTLLQHAPGHVTALDLFPRFIDMLKGRARRLGLEDRLSAVEGSMEDLPFERESLDLIWAEGSIYNMGFERGLNEWNGYLKKGGYIAVSEISWLTETRPEEIGRFWTESYPEIDLVSGKVRKMEQAGYTPVAVFTLPAFCWEENFYHPMSDVMEAFLKKYPDSVAVKELIDNQHAEIGMYRTYRDFYGYVFYIGKK